MATLELHGRINSSGQLELDLPPGLPEGDIIVRLEVPQPSTAWEHQPWTEDELRQMMNQSPLNPAEFASWLVANPPAEPWGELGADEDAAAYVHWMRRQRHVNLDEPELEP